PAELVVGETGLDGEVSPFNEACLFQALAQRDTQALERRLGRAAQIADNSDRLLCARSERQRGRAKARDEIAPPHSITSSAVARSCGWISMPSDLAVLRLITNSNLLDWITGRSDGFSPFRIRPV